MVKAGLCLYWHSICEPPIISDRKKIYLNFDGLYWCITVFWGWDYHPSNFSLSAVEGSVSLRRCFNQWLEPLSIGIITGLFLVQRHGTGTMGKFFGPLTLLWFLSIGALGMWSIIQTPLILMVSPHWAFSFILINPMWPFSLWVR